MGTVVVNGHDPYPYVILGEYVKVSLAVIMDTYKTL